MDYDNTEGHTGNAMHATHKQHYLLTHQRVVSYCKLHARKGATFCTSEGEKLIIDLGTVHYVPFFLISSSNIQVIGRD